MTKTKQTRGYIYPHKQEMQVPPTSSLSNDIGQPQCTSHHSHLVFLYISSFPQIPEASGQWLHSHPSSNQRQMTWWWLKGEVYSQQNSRDPSPPICPVLISHVTCLGVLNDSCAGYGAAIATDVAVDAAPGGVVAVIVGVGYGDCQGGRMSGNWSCLGPRGLSCPLLKKLGFGPTGTAAPAQPHSRF